MTDKMDTSPETAPVSICKYSFIIAVCTFACTLILYVTGLTANGGSGLLSLAILY